MRLASLTLANSCRKIWQNSSHLPWWMFLDSGLIWLRWKNEPSSKFELSVVLVWLSIEQSDRWLTAKSAFCLQPLAECFQRSAGQTRLGWAGLQGPSSMELLSVLPLLLLKPCLLVSMVWAGPGRPGTPSLPTFLLMTQWLLLLHESQAKPSPFLPAFDYLPCSSADLEGREQLPSMHRGRTIV